MDIAVLFILYNAESAQRGNGTIFEEFFKNYLHEVESVLKIYILALVLPLLFRLRINVIQFPVYALYFNNTQNNASTCRSCCIDKRLRKRFLTINTHNRMLDVTCHRNFEITYLKDIEGKGGSASSRINSIGF
jgi:hypothetical protein